MSFPGVRTLPDCVAKPQYSVRAVATGDVSTTDGSSEGNTDGAHGGTIHSTVSPWKARFEAVETRLPRNAAGERKFFSG